VNEEYRIVYGYLDELLRVQSKAADMYEHPGVLGAVREKFLHKQIIERSDYPSYVHTGQVIANNQNAGQHDIIIRKSGAMNPTIGGHVRIVAEECAAVIEVKSNARGVHFRDFNDKAGEMKAENPDLVCGMFCYKLGLKKRTILKRFGIDYDLEYLDFEIDTGLPVDYPNIDFVVCVDEDEEFVTRNEEQYSYNKFFYIDKNQNPDDKYDLTLQPPFSYHFLSQIQMAFYG